MYLHEATALVPSQDFRDHEGSMCHWCDPSHADVVEVDVGEGSVVTVPDREPHQEALAIL